MTRILVAYDGSPAARRALEHAGDLAKPDDAVVVVTVMPEPPVSARIERPAGERNTQWRLLEEAREMIGARGIRAETEAPVGDVAQEILAAAERVDADVIVVAHHRGRRPHVHGSTTDRIVHGAHCDVLVVYAG